jgi:CheY-like chemotaxis protein/anti-sigma regulatory factor (Ser/Thr protein kinase)
MLLGGKLAAKDVPEGIETIHRSALAQGQLIDDLLDVSRMTSGKMVLSLRDMRISEVLTRAVAAAQPMAQGRGVELKADIPAGTGWMLADPDRIQQVIWNLLNNAVKFTPRGGQVTLQARRTDGQLEIAVSDTGIGIAKAFLPRVFQRFSQAETASTRQHGGLGLGLSIAKQLVELHGGCISVHSEGEGRGSTFTVLLPIVQSTGGNFEIPLPPLQQSLAGADVLLVEDDAAAQLIMLRVLEAGGASVRTAASAADARAAFRQRQPDLVLSDVGMAVEDGHVLIGQLRELEKEQGLRPTPAIAITAFAGPDHHAQAIKAGFDEHLGKPIDPDQLVALAAALLAAHRGKP